MFRGFERLGGGSGFGGFPRPMHRGGAGVSPCKRRMAAAKPKIPAGLIVLFNDTVVPSGWTRFASADDKLIVGAGDTYSPGAAGAGDTQLVSTGTTSAGAHAASVRSDIRADGAGSMYIGGSGVSAGAHSHAANAITYTPEWEQLLLIQADAVVKKLPAGAGFLSTENIAGLTQILANNKFLRSGASLTNGGDAESGFTVESSAGGSGHYHTSGSTYGTQSGPTTEYDNHSKDTSHTHDITATITDNGLRQFYLSVWSMASKAFNLAANAIAMFESLTPPTGWKLCDGTKGTPDLRNYFVRLSDDVNQGIYSGDGDVNWSAVMETASWTHTHGKVFNDNVPHDAWYHATQSASHNHTLSTGSGTKSGYLPPYYALAFIMPE